MNFKNATYKAAARVVDVDTENGIVRWKERPRSSFKTTSAWRAWNSRYVGQVAGATGGEDGRTFKFGDYHISVARVVARAIWGNKVDDKFVYHVNGDKHDCRAANLRLIDGTERRTLAKSKNGPNRGVYFRNGRYQAYRRIKGVLKFLGSYETEPEARKAFEEAVVK